MPFSHDNMVVFDVTIQASIMEEACDVANHYWQHFLKKNELTLHGPCGQVFKYGQCPVILLEVAGTPALKGLLKADHFSWIRMVAPKIASVSFSLSRIIIDDLDKAVAIIKEHNSQYKTNLWRMGHGSWTS